MPPKPWLALNSSIERTRGPALNASERSRSHRASTGVASATTWSIRRRSRTGSMAPGPRRRAIRSAEPRWTGWWPGHTTGSDRRGDAPLGQRSGESSSRAVERNGVHHPGRCSIHQQGPASPGWPPRVGPRRPAASLRARCGRRLATGRRGRAPSLATAIGHCPVITLFTNWDANVQPGGGHPDDSGATIEQTAQIAGSHGPDGAIGWREPAYRDPSSRCVSEI